MIGGMTQGDQPRHNWKPEYPVDALMVFMMQNQMRGRAHTQPFWLWLTWKQIDWFTVLLVCSLDPLVSWWYPDDILRETPVSLVKAFQKHETKSMSLSETKSLGRPFSQYQLLKTRSAMSSAEVSVLVGMR